MSVGPDEVVVTFTSAPGERGHDTGGRRTRSVTTGPFHTAPGRPASSPTPSTSSRSRARSPTTGGCPAQVRTLARPRGRLLATVATANDVHFGETECGRTGDPATDAIGRVLQQWRRASRRTPS